MSLLDDIVNKDNLIRALEGSAPKRSAPKRDHLEYGRLVYETAETVRALSQELTAESFEFLPAQLIVLPKDRPILSISIRERVVERAVHQVIEPRLRRELCFPATFARRRALGEAPRSLSELSRGFTSVRSRKPYVFETDIRKFFPSIRLDVLRTTLDSLLPDDSITWLLEQVVRRRPRPDTLAKALEAYEKLYGDRNRGIPQGSVLSPLLASAYLHPFDKSMAEEGIAYLRYVDDLVAFAEDEARAKELEGVISGRLSEIGLEVYITEEPGTKAKIAGPDVAVTFVGLEFRNGMVYPRSEAFKHFESRIKELETECPTLRRLLIALANFVEGWYSAYRDCELSRSTRRRLDEIQIGAIRRFVRRKGLLSRKYPPVSSLVQARAIGAVLIRDFAPTFDLPIDDSDWFGTEPEAFMPLSD